MNKLNQGGLPLVLAQTFRAIIHSRMQVGMERYERHYPDADIVLFEPAREDADMFFANIFSYSQRKRLCASAYVKTRAAIRARADILAPKLLRHGIALNAERLADEHRKVTDAVSDPRPLRTDPVNARDVRQATRDLSHTLDQLERWLARPH